MRLQTVFAKRFPIGPAAQDLARVHLDVGYPS